MTTCERLGAELEARRHGAARPLSGPEVAHLDACRSCREAAADVDPLALFALLALERRPDHSWTGFDTRVLAAARASGRRRDWVAALLRPRGLAVAGGAAAIAALALVVRLETGDARPTPQDVRAGAAMPGPGAIDWVLGAARAVLAERRADPGSEAAAPPARPIALARLRPIDSDRGEPVPVEAVSSPTATIISLSIHPDGELDAHAASDASDVVLIVDEEIDL